MESKKLVFKKETKSGCLIDISLEGYISEAILNEINKRQKEPKPGAKIILLSNPKGDK